MTTITNAVLYENDLFAAGSPGGSACMTQYEFCDERMRYRNIEESYNTFKMNEDLLFSDPFPVWFNKNYGKIPKDVLRIRSALLRAEINSKRKPQSLRIAVAHNSIRKQYIRSIQDIMSEYSDGTICQGDDDVSIGRKKNNKFQRFQRVVETSDFDLPELENITDYLDEAFPQGAAMSSFSMPSMPSIDVNVKVPFVEKAVERGVQASNDFREMFGGLFNRIGFKDIAQGTEISVLIALWCYMVISRKKVAYGLVYVCCAYMIYNNTSKEFDFVKGPWSILRNIKKWIDNNPSDVADMATGYNSASADARDREFYGQKASDVEDPILMEVMPQGFDEMSPYLTEGFVALVSGLMGLRSKDPVEKWFSSFMRFNEGHRSKVSNGLTHVAMKLSDMFASMQLDGLAAWFHTTPYDSIETEKVVKAIEKYVAACNSGLAYCNGFTVEVVESLKMDAISIQRKLKPSDNDHKLITRALQTLTEHVRLNASKMGSLSGDRVEPVGVLLKGASGIMKSVALQRLARIVAQLTIPEAWMEDFLANPSKFMFPLPTDKFYDTYDYKVWVVTSDDFGQRREVAGDDAGADSLRAIKIVNTVPYPLQMANVDQKNSMYMRSPFFMASTNRSDFNDMAAYSGLAVERRFHFTVSVSCNSKYLTNGKVDVAKLPCKAYVVREKKKIVKGYNAVTQEYEYGEEEFDGIQMKNSEIPEDFWIFHAKVYTANRYKWYNNLSFESLVRMIIEKYKKNVFNFYTNKISVEKSFADICKKIKANDLSMWHMSDNPTFVEVLPQSGMPGDFPKIPTVNDHVDEVMYKHIDQQIKVAVHGLSKLPEFDPCIELDYRVPEDVHSSRLLVHVLQKHEGLDLLIDSKRFKWVMQVMPPEWWEDIMDKGGSKAFFEAYAVVISELYWKGLSFEGKPVTNWEKLVATAKEKMKIFVKWAASLSATPWLLMALGGYIAYKFVPPLVSLITAFFDGDDEAEVQSGHSGRSEPKIRLRSTVKLAKANKPVLIRNVKFQSGDFEIEEIPKITSADLNLQRNVGDIVSTMFNKWFYLMYVVNNTDPDDLKFVRLGHATNIIGPYFMFPFHFILQLSEVYKNLKEGESRYVVFSLPNKRKTFRFDIEHILKETVTVELAGNADYCLFYNNQAQITSSGAIKFFLKNNDLRKLEALKFADVDIFGTYIPSKSSDKSLVIRNTRTRAKCLGGASIAVKSTWESDYSHYNLDQILEYAGDFGPGDCGSLIISSDSHFDCRRVIGFHLAGGKTGFSNVITQETIMDIVNSYSDGDIFFSQELEPEYELVEPVAQGNFEVDKKLKKFTPMMRNSEIKKSNFYGKLMGEFSHPAMRPARLRPFDREGITIDPLMEALKNYNFPLKSISNELIASAIGSYEEVMMQNPYSKNKKPALDMIEILHGYGSLKGISPTTSAGIPYQLPGVDNLKEMYYYSVEKNGSKHEETVRIRQRIADEVADLEQMYLDGIRPVFIFTDNLKDEKRRKDSTRLFSGSPFILLCLFRKYFGAIMDYFIEKNIDVGIGIGVNPFSMDWDKMARQLSVFFDAGACDYSKFDGHQFPCILWAIGIMFIRWYGEDGFTRIRIFLWTEICASKHNVAGWLFEWFCNLPSGNPMTALINCIYNQLNFRMCWILANQPIDLFNSKVVVKTMGDDGVFTISPEHIDFFNEIVLPGLMSQIGMVYTNERKDETVMKKSRRLEELEFLKRSFVFDKLRNRWIAPIRFEDNIEILNWTKKKFGDRIAVDNVGNVLREISLHGKKQYDLWRPHLVELVQEYYPGMTPSYTILSDHKAMYEKTLLYEYTF